MVTDEVMKAIGTVLLSFLSAYGASLLAYSKFKRERNRDERTKASSTVTDAIEEMLFWCEQARAEYCCEPFNGANTNFEANHRHLIRAAASGEVVFSAKFFNKVKDADIAVARAIYAADEESKGLNSEKEIAEAHFHKAVAIRDALEPHFLELNSIAKAERAHTLLSVEWLQWVRRKRKVSQNAGS